MTILNAANLLSFYRPFAAILCVYTLSAEHWLYAAAIYLAALLTDLADGIIARKLGTDSPLGGLIDHTCDAVFVVILLAAWSANGLMTPLLPFLVALAFLQYVLDSKALSGQRLKPSRLGRWNGIAYFGLAGIPIGGQLLGIDEMLAGWISWAAWLLVLSTVLSMLDRGQILYRTRAGNQVRD